MERILMWWGDRFSQVWIQFCHSAGRRALFGSSFCHCGNLYSLGMQNVLVCPAGAGLLQLVWAVWAGCGKQRELAQSPATSSIWTRTTQCTVGPMPGVGTSVTGAMCHRAKHFDVPFCCLYFYLLAIFTLNLHCLWFQLMYLACFVSVSSHASICWSNFL